MKTVLLIAILISVTVNFSCSKDPAVQTIPIPNGDFESWNNMPVLANWKTNSCPTCVPPYETYIVRRDPSAYSGQFAAKFIYNNVYAAWAENKFLIPHHPIYMTGNVKCNLFQPDTVSLKIFIYNNNAVIDSGQWLGTASIANYMGLIIPITQSNLMADSALIRIQGGNKNGFPNNNTEFWVDNLSLQ